MGFLIALGLLFGLVIILFWATLDKHNKINPNVQIVDFFNRIIPESDIWSAAAGVLLAIPLAMLAILNSTEHGPYGFLLFVVLPFCCGVFPVLVYGYHAPRSKGNCILVSFISVGLLGLLILGFSVEGALCALGGCPLAFGIALAGASVGYDIQSIPRM